MSLRALSTIEELEAACPWLLGSTYSVHMDCGRFSLKEADRAKFIASGVDPGILRRCPLPKSNPQIMHYADIPGYPPMEKQ